MSNQQQWRDAAAGTNTTIIKTTVYFFFARGLSLSCLLLLPGSLLVVRSLLVCVCVFVFVYACVKRIPRCFRIFSKCTAQKFTTKQEEITAIAAQQQHNNNNNDNSTHTHNNHIDTH